MTPKDIKEIFGIDILEKNRRLPYVYLKNIYVNEQYDNEVPILHIANTLGMNHSAILSLRKRNEVFQSRPDFMLIKKSYESKNMTTFESGLNSIKKRKPPYQRNVSEKLNKNKPDKRWHSSKIIEILRKYPTHRLWNIPMNEFTRGNYKTLEELKSDSIGVK